MRIAIRMDDITPDMDWNKFKRFKNLLDEHDDEVLEVHPVPVLVP